MESTSTNKDRFNKSSKATTAQTVLNQYFHSTQNVQYFSKWEYMLSNSNMKKIQEPEYSRKTE